MTVHNNQEQLILWKEPKLYSGSRYKVDQGYWQDYDDWLDDNDTGTKLTLDIYRQTITEPMKLTQSLPNMDGYTYGKLSNAGKWYYIFIDRVTTDQYGTSTIEYSIDWWATEWTNINCTKAHLTRKHIKPQYMEQPFTPLFTTSTQEAITQDFCFMATYIPSNDYTTSSIQYVVLEGTVENYNLIVSGLWQSALWLADSDVKDCFVVPLFSYDTIKDSTDIQTLYIIDRTDIPSIRTEVNSRYSAVFQSASWTGNARIYCINTQQRGNIWTIYYDSTEPGNIGIQQGIVTATGYPCDMTTPLKEIITMDSISGGQNKYITNFMRKDYPDVQSSAQPFNVSLNVVKQFQSVETQKQGVMDWNGNLVWECPYGITVDGFLVRLLLGVSHVMLEFIPRITGQTLKQSDVLTGTGFTYDCRHPAIFIDSYREYVLKNRDYDIAMRQIQSDKQLWTSVAGIGESIGYGYAFGDSASAHKGGSTNRAPIGAIASGAGSILNTIGTFAINATFDPQIQQQYDNRYLRMTDQISLVGDSITDIMNEYPLKKYTLTMDSATQTRMSNDINTNGYYCDEIVTNLNNLFHRGRVLQADNITVEGAVQLDCRYQVVNRLMNGVEFI